MFTFGKVMYVAIRIWQCTKGRFSNSMIIKNQVPHGRNGLCHGRLRMCMSFWASHRATTRFVHNNVKIAKDSDRSINPPHKTCTWVVGRLCIYTYSSPEIETLPTQLSHASVNITDCEWSRALDARPGQGMTCRPFCQLILNALLY